MRVAGPALCLLSLFLAACSGGPAAAPVTPVAPQGAIPAAFTSASTAIDWPTFGFDRQRHGYNGHESVLTPATVTHLVSKWRFALGSQYVDTQPIVASNVALPSGTAQFVYVGDEAGDFYAVNAATGTAVWSKSLGRATTTCGTHSDGITSAPVIDRTNNRIYVVDGLMTMSAFDLATGASAPGFPPKTVYGDPSINHIWSSLQLTRDGSEIFFETASHCDEGTYYGTVNTISTSTQAIHTFQLVTNQSQYFGNGSWSWGGATIDPDDGNVYASVGNSLGGAGESGQYSDSVIALTHGLKFVADEQPETNLTNDLDIGATPVPYDDQGKCLAFQRKDGAFFTVDRTALANGAFATKLNLGGQLATPAYSPVAHALYAAVPNGVTKLAVGAKCTVSMTWQTQIGASGYSPNVVAGNVVYAAGGTKLYAIDARSGAVLWNSGTAISGTITAAPTVVNGRVYVTASDGHLYAFGL